MTGVCLVGAEDGDLRRDLLAYESARAALSTYELSAPYENALAVETISLGMAVSLLNDLDWYLARVARDAFVREPSVDESEWLSRDAARAIRDGDVDPDETATTLKVYGVVDGRLVEPMYVTRPEGAGVPAYDLRDAEDTVVVRLVPGESGA
ncbi:MAG: DUF5804 family protein [Halobacteriaceae archaeon]